MLAGDTPRLIDEWQIEPAIWNHVRRAVDQSPELGRFILTGSSVPADDATRHTGAGRFTRLRMRPFSLHESGQSSGRMSLASLLAAEPQSAARHELPIPDLAKLICVGGWPGNLARPEPAALRVNRGYVREVQHVDISRVGDKQRDPLRVERLMRSLARNVATPASMATMAADVGANGNGLKVDTVAEYLDALERLMVVENQPPWAPNLRSRTSLRTSAVRHFVDPSLAVAALRTTPERLLRDLNLMGLLFESMVVRDLRVYAQAADARVFHYCERAGGLEVDAVVEAADGHWAAFEVKLGERLASEGVRNLERFAARMKSSDHPKPSALAVITPSGYGVARPGIVGRIPIGALGP